jgi:hypothetical protein
LAEALEKDKKPEEMPLIEEGPKEIAASSEMMTVMDSLIPRERSVIEALIKCNGRMIQA